MCLVSVLATQLAVRSGLAIFSGVHVVKAGDLNNCKPLSLPPHMHTHTHMYTHTHTHTPHVLLLDPRPGISSLATISPSRGGGGVVSGVDKRGGFEVPPSDFEPEEVCEHLIN